MAAQLQDLQRKWKQLLRDNQWKPLFDSLAIYLDEAADASNTALVLQSEYNRTQKRIVEGTMTQEQITVTYANLTHRVSSVIGTIETEDLVPDWQARFEAEVLLASDTPPVPAETSGGQNKNVITGSSITAGGNVHIGDVVHHYGSDATKPSPSQHPLSPSEKEGIERAIALKIKIINKLRETLALEDDPIRSIKYEEQLRQAEEELAELKAKLG
jgi:hypothetical protein